MFPKEATQVDLKPKGAGDLTEKDLNALRRPGQLPSSMFIRSTPASESKAEPEPVEPSKRGRPRKQKAKPEPMPEPKLKLDPKPKPKPRPIKEPDFEELNRRSQQECIRGMTNLVRAQMEVVRKEQDALCRYEMALDIYVHGLPQGGEPVPEKQEGK